VTQRDDDFLARTPFAVPRGDDLNQGSSGYAEGLRGARAERRTGRRNERRTALRYAFVVGAGVMGAAVVAAATFTVLVFAGLFTVSSGGGGGSHPVTLVQQPPVTTTPPPSPSEATDPALPSDTLPPSEATGAFPATTAQAGRSSLPSSNRVAVPRATAGAQVPGRSPSISGGVEQLSSASSPPPSDEPAPATPTTSAPDTNPAGYAPPGRNK
jgi:hypothetical protein